MCSIHQDHLKDTKAFSFGGNEEGNEEGDQSEDIETFKPVFEMKV